MTLFLPVGPPGSGKSTLAGHMTSRHILVQDAVVSTDNIRRVMTGSPTDQSANGPAWEVARTVTHTRLEHGLTVYFDATNLKPEWYDKMLAKAKAKGHRVLFIFFDTPYPLCRRHNLARKELAIPDTAVERMIEQHRAIDPESLKSEGDIIAGSDLSMLLTGITTWLDEAP